MSNKKNIVGAQVSSLRPYLQTPQELRASLQKLADMGYRTVQMQWWNPEFEPELVAARRAGRRAYLRFHARPLHSRTG